MTATKTHPPNKVAPGPVPDFLRVDAKPACREPDVDPDWFFPVGDRYSDEGRAVCRRCPLEVECGDWAIRTGEQWGLWGALDPVQRDARRRMLELAHG